MTNTTNFTVQGIIIESLADHVANVFVNLSNVLPLEVTDARILTLTEGVIDAIQHVSPEDEFLTGVAYLVAQGLSHDDADDALAGAWL